MSLERRVMVTLRALAVMMAALVSPPAMAGADAFDKGMAAYEAKNFGKARSILTGLANAGNAKAQYWLGAMNELGLGGSADSAMALKWYRKSAEHNNADAQYTLGEKLLTGNGLDNNPTEAISWFRKAAASGHLGAFLMLAICYRDGAGVPKDIVMAHVFANISTSKRGKMDLVERVKIAKELGVILTPEQRAESDALQFGGMAALSKLPDSSTTGRK